MTQIPIDITADQAPESVTNHLMALYQKGQLVEVVEQASQLVQEFPHTFMIWSVLGAAASQIGNSTLAESALRQAIAIDPNDFNAPNNLANVLDSQGKHDEAIEAYRQAITLKPDYAAGYHNMAVSLRNQGKYDEAIAACQQALSLKPDFTDAYKNLAVSFNAQEKFDEAVAAYQQVISVKPDDFEAYNNLAITLNHQGKYDEAIAACQQALSLKPDFAEAYNNLAVSFNDQGKLDDALTASKHALFLKPDFAETYNNIAITMKSQGKYDKAIVAYQQALTLKPDSAETYNNLANALSHQGMYDESIAAYKQALTLKPDDAVAYNNLAVSFNHQGKLDEALTACQQALDLKPNYAEAKINLSHLMLKKGELKEGFELMVYRMQEHKSRVPTPRENLIWHPEDDLQGKHFVVYEEQGLGDIVQFCRYLPLLEQRGANVSFKVRPKLHTLLATLESQITLMEALPAEEEVDFEAPLLSLPHLLGTALTNIPAPIPYLYADDANIKTWSKVLSKKAFKIGICWQGSSTSKVDHGRSLSLSLFAEIAQISGVELISLHKGEGEEQLENIDFPVTTLAPNFDAGKDAFVDTAAVMTLCDLIITSDTSIAHLAGAMGCQTWVALQYSPEWRWMLNRTDSPWYPTMTLYRQRHSGDWQGVFAALEHDVRAQLNQKGIIL